MSSAAFSQLIQLVDVGNLAGRGHFVGVDKNAGRRPIFEGETA